MTPATRTTMNHVPHRRPKSSHIELLVDAPFLNHRSRFSIGLNHRGARVLPTEQKPAKVVCSAIRAQDIGKGRIEPFVKVN